MKLKSKFIMFFTIFALVPLLISGIIISSVLQSANKKDAYGRLKEELAVSQNSMVSTINMLKNVALDSQNDTLVSNYLSGKRSEDGQAALMKKYKNQMDKYGVFANIIFRDKDEVVLFDAINSTTKNNDKLDYVSKAMQTKQVVLSSVKQSSTTGNPVFVMAIPILGEKSEAVGCISYSVDLQKLSEKYVTNIKIGSSGYIYVINNEGTTVMHPKKEEIFQKGILKTTVGNDIIKTKTGIAEYEYSGVKKIVAYSEDKEMGLIYLANIPTSEFTGTTKAIINLMLIIGVFALIGSVSMSVLIAKNLSNHINDVAKAMENISTGDFTTKVTVKGKDEIGIMADKINDTMDQLRFSISGVKDTSTNIGNMAGSLAETSKEMNAAANEVALALEGIANGTVDQNRELLDISKQLDIFNSELNGIYDKVSNVSTSSKDAENKAVLGKEFIESLTASISKIKNSFSIVNSKISGLASTVGEIGNITDSINGISEQTNLLALNAAIEAARAGEQGKGFAVVADEVRKLAEQSSKASGEIMNLINSVRNETDEVINTSKQMDTLIGDQSGVVEKTVQALDNILQSVENIAPLVDETYISVKNAIQAKDVVFSKIEGAVAVAEEISASTEEISASAEELLSSTEEVADIAVKSNEAVNILISRVEGFKVE